MSAQHIYAVSRFTDLLYVQEAPSNSRSQKADMIQVLESPVNLTLNLCICLLHMS
jgi:hypothetical protein